MPDWKGPERRTRDRTQDRDVSILAERLVSLHSDVAEIKGAIRELTQAITKLALVEERLSNASAAQERMFVALSALESRIVTLETYAPLNNQVTKWAAAAIVAIISGAIGYAFKVHG